jgi:hypothetical protein
LFFGGEREREIVYVVLLAFYAYGKGATVFKLSVAGTPTQENVVNVLFSLHFYLVIEEEAFAYTFNAMNMLLL